MTGNLQQLPPSPAQPVSPEQVVRLDCLVNVLHVDANGHTHEHVLGALNNFAVQAQQVGALQGLRITAYGAQERVRAGQDVCRRRSHRARGERTAMAGAGMVLADIHFTHAQRLPEALRALRAASLCCRHTNQSSRAGHKTRAWLSRLITPVTRTLKPK